MTLKYHFSVLFDFAVKKIDNLWLSAKIQPKKALRKCKELLS